MIQIFNYSFHNQTIILSSFCDVLFCWLLSQFVINYCDLRPIFLSFFFLLFKPCLSRFLITIFVAKRIKFRMFCHVPFCWLRKRTCNKTLRGGQIFTLFLYFFYSNCVYHDFLIQLSEPNI